MAARRFLHLFARLAIAGTWTSSAAALDAAHIPRTAAAISRHAHSLGVRWHEAGSNGQPVTINRPFFGKSQPAAQQGIAAQPDRTEEIGKQ